MKLKIEKEFIDKYTGKKYKADDVVEFEEGRAKELLSDTRELVSKVTEETEKPAEKKPAKKSKK